MGAGVVEVLAFQINASAAEFLGESPCKIEWRRTPGIVLKQVIEFGSKRRIVPNRIICGGEFIERCGERLRHVTAAVLSPIPFAVRFEIHIVAFAAAIKAATLP
jgi:hypothetical protein